VGFKEIQHMSFLSVLSWSLMTKHGRTKH